MATEPYAGPRRAPSSLSSVEARLWSLALVALAGDLLLTYYGIAHVGLSEGNPIAGPLFRDHGYAALAALKGLALAVAVAGRQALTPDYRWVAPCSLAAPWVLASSVNAVRIASSV